MFKKKTTEAAGSVTPRNETQGMLNFSKEMISALATALVFIIYVIQAFTIPTGSMEKSLRVGDFLLGIKFIYGSPVIPFTYMKFPGVTTPKRGDVIIFKYPGYDKKDYIKRCVAVAGDTLWMDEKDLYVNGIKLDPPPEAQFTQSGRITGGMYPAIEKFAPLYIPKKGDTLVVSGDLPWREYSFYKRLIRQEHPRKSVTEKITIFYGEQDITHKIQYPQGARLVPFSQDLVNRWDRESGTFWLNYDLNFLRLYQINKINPDSVRVNKTVLLDGEPLQTYVCKNNNYFMIGDNRDESQDSRFWGFLNGNFIKAKAFIIYFALNRDKVTYTGSDGRVRKTDREQVPWIKLPMKIRWNRMGKLIRGWDGKPEGVETLDPKEKSQS